MAILFGLLMFLCSLALDVLFLYQHESTGLTVTVSDALAGLVAGVLAWRLLRFEAERRSRMEERLVVISDMNHHIRNALQVISYSAQGSRSQQELAGIMDSVDRIQWALREVLPKVEPSFQPLGGKPTRPSAPGGRPEPRR